LGLPSSLSSVLFGGDESKNDKEAIYRLPDYVITASRFPEVIDELSPSVSYISLEQLESSHWQSLSDVLLQMPGAFLVSNGGMGTVTSLFTRGSESNHTTFLLNGRRLPSGFSGNYDVGQISLVNLSSVDMVRGDNSSLHGDGAIGGVVNLRSAKATIGLKQSVQVEGGSDDFTHCNYSYAFRDDRSI
jgi:vitamin B12 transporter